MADVINMSDHRKKKPIPSPQEVVLFCTDAVMQEWERFAKNNRLNEYFTSSIPSYAKHNINYLSDLDEIAVVEGRISLLPGIWAPGINGPSQFGWRACFRFGEVLVETPDMASEPYARCCNILIFLKVKREMVLLSKPGV